MTTLRDNPRFAAWARANNKTPDDVLKHIPFYEYPIWNRAQIIEFSRVKPDAVLFGHLVGHDEYDAWLLERYPQQPINAAGVEVMEVGTP